MKYTQLLNKPWRYFVKCSSIIAVFLLVSLVCSAQARPVVQQPDVPWLHELDKYPGLLPELIRLVEKFQHDLQVPPGRSESRLMPLLPDSTFSYVAFPNYGDVAHQLLQIFRRELQESSVLRDWWQHGALAKAGPVAEDSLEKFRQLSQYLGEEIVTSATLEVRNPKLLVVAEIRKPGLKMFLHQMLNELPGKSKPPVRVFDPQELSSAEDRGPSQEFLVLVRPDFVVGALDLATLRGFSTQLDRRSREFGSTPFGQRIAQAYIGGVTILGAADIHNILSQIPHGTPQDESTFQLSGFADMKYLVWEHSTAAAQASGQAELSFTRPRHGAASWLAAPAPMGSLDFVSPGAIVVGTALLKSPVEILAEVREIAGVSNPNAFAALDLSEQALKVSLKEDLLRYLGGEITFELDSLGSLDDKGRQATPVGLRTNEQMQGVETPLALVWKAILRVNEPDRLQQTFATLFTAAHIAAEARDNGGLTFYTVRVPSKADVEIAYAFAGGYLIIASSRETLVRAIRIHKAGESLGQSKKFLSLLPPGHPSGVSALFYEDPLAAVAMQIRRLAPDIAGAFPKFSIESMPVMVCAYGEKTAIREESTNMAFDVGAVLVAAAIAIPNLLRSRVAANEASAVGTVRTLNTAQITYAATNPERGYAPDLATLGPDPSGTVSYSADHAGIIDATLGNPSCTASAWCRKSGFRFSVTAVCKHGLCDEFVVVSTPVDSNTGGRNFCSTSDGVIRFNKEPPLTAPVTVSECRIWPPL
jgi:type II secretory pathway pseudopilin PulG